MYTLYCRNTAGSMAPEALLAACGAEYKVIVLERNADGSFEEFFHKINPKAEVPTLVLPDDSIMTESAAMMIYLADLHPKAGLSPAIGAPERARFLRWQLFLATQIYMSDLRLFYPERYTVAGAEAQGIKARALETMMREFAIYAEALGEGPFILGSKMCAADIYAAMVASWAPDVDSLFTAHPALARMYEGVLQNEAVRRVWERNGA
jgi:glutathione S-transferase/GST-like protein